MDLVGLIEAGFDPFSSPSSAAYRAVNSGDPAVAHTFIFSAAHEAANVVRAIHSSPHKREIGPSSLSAKRWKQFFSGFLKFFSPVNCTVLLLGSGTSQKPLSAPPEIDMGALGLIVKCGLTRRLPAQVECNMGHVRFRCQPDIVPETADNMRAAAQVPIPDIRDPCLIYTSPSPRD